MAEINNNDIYFTLDKQVEQKFILSQNQQALIYARDQAIADYTRAMVTIPSALVNLKWQNRREIYPLRVKEEVYGAVLAEIIARYPELKSLIMVQLEENYQQLKAQEALTLMLSRTLAEGTCKTTTVKPVAPAADGAPQTTKAVAPQAVAQQAVPPAAPQAVPPVSQAAAPAAPSQADIPAPQTAASPVTYANLSSAKPLVAPARPSSAKP